MTFGHRNFAWGSEGGGKAHVHVVIIGLALRDQAPKDRRIFDYADYDADPTESVVPVISPYLFNAANLAAPHTVVYEQAAPFDAMPSMIIGSKPIDGGNYILSDEEHDAPIKAEPPARAYLHPFIGSEELIYGGRCPVFGLHKPTPLHHHLLNSAHKPV